MLYSEKNETLKQYQKDVIYEYILTFVSWWSIFWLVVDGGGHILACGGWWCWEYSLV